MLDSYFVYNITAYTGTLQSVYMLNISWMCSVIIGLWKYLTNLLRKLFIWQFITSLVSCVINKIMQFNKLPLSPKRNVFYRLTYEWGKHFSKFQKKLLDQNNWRSTKSFHSQNSEKHFVFFWQDWQEPSIKYIAKA